MIIHASLLPQLTNFFHYSQQTDNTARFKRQIKNNLYPIQFITVSITVSSFNSRGVHSRSFLMELSNLHNCILETQRIYFLPKITIAVVKFHKRHILKNLNKTYFLSIKMPLASNLNIKFIIDIISETYCLLFIKFSSS